MKKMHRCMVCRSYTLDAIHCQMATGSAHPARFKPNDPYARERRMARYGMEPVSGS